MNIISQVEDGESSTICAKQVHGANIVRAQDAVSRPVEADGIFITTPQTNVGIKTADCMPLGLVGKEGILLLHVSRKTLVAGLLDNVSKFLHPKYISRIYIGPHICADHFSFEWEGQEVTQFKEKFSDAVTEKEGVLYVSLRDAVQQYLTAWNVDADIQEDGRCTFEDNTLPSYKRWLAEEKKGKLAQIVTRVED